jgi:CheY-like chemotaxis protein
MGFAELLKMKFDDSSTTEGHAADVIIQGAERAANLTKQLLGFARGGMYNPVLLNINDIIIETNKLTEKGYAKNVRVKFNLDKSIHLIKAEKSQMEQVLTNLVINSRDFMPSGGKLIFETENVYISEEFGDQYSGYQKGDYIKFSVIDNGEGIPKEFQDKVFEPFFTTKKVGEGVGLGLATVYGIVKNHGGHIELFSELNEGTRFTVYLPAAEEVGVIGKPAKKAKLIEGKGETILVVDDEENVRNLARLQLQQLGYKAVLAADGKEALNIFRKRKDDINLVLLDVIMPELDGLKTYRRLIKSDPNLKVLVMSGFSKDGKASEILNEGAFNFIQKPFRIQEFSVKINQALKGR